MSAWAEGVVVLLLWVAWSMPAWAGAQINGTGFVYSSYHIRSPGTPMVTVPNCGGFTMYSGESFDIIFLSIDEIRLGGRDALPYGWFETGWLYCYEPVLLIMHGGSGALIETPLVLVATPPPPVTDAPNDPFPQRDVAITREQDGSTIIEFIVLTRPGSGDVSVHLAGIVKGTHAIERIAEVSQPSTMGRADFRVAVPEKFEVIGVRPVEPRAPLTMIVNLPCNGNCRIVK